MPIYISLLRGINVGGSKIVLMDDLKKAFEKSGFSEVETYIQSGNVIFISEKKTMSELEGLIKAAIKSKFDFDVGILVLELDELQEIIRKNPFGKDKLRAGEKIYFTILSEKPSKDKIAELHKTKSPVDDFEIINKTVYVFCRKGYTKSPFNNNSVEKVLRVNGTTRNLETMKKLVEIGKAIERT